MEFYDKNKTGELGSRLAGDTELIMDSVTTNISMFFKASVGIIGMTALILYISYKLTLVLVLLMIPLVPFAITMGKVGGKL